VSSFYLPNPLRRWKEKIDASWNIWRGRITIPVTGKGGGGVEEILHSSDGDRSLTAWQAREGQKETTPMRNTVTFLDSQLWQESVVDRLPRGGPRSKKCKKNAENVVKLTET